MFSVYASFSTEYYNLYAGSFVFFFFFFAFLRKDDIIKWEGPNGIMVLLWPLTQHVSGMHRIEENHPVTHRFHSLITYYQKSPFLVEFWKVSFLYFNFFQQTSRKILCRNTTFGLVCLSLILWRGCNSASESECHSQGHDIIRKHVLGQIQSIYMMTTVLEVRQGTVGMWGRRISCGRDRASLNRGPPPVLISVLMCIWEFRWSLSLGFPPRDDRDGGTVRW